MLITIDADQVAKVNEICDRKGYKSMTLTQLREVIKSLDKSNSKELVNHSLMSSKEQILDFLYGWEWSQLFDLDITN